MYVLIPLLRVVAVIIYSSRKVLPTAEALNYTARLAGRNFLHTASQIVYLPTILRADVLKRWDMYTRQRVPFSIYIIDIHVNRRERASDKGDRHTTRPCVHSGHRHLQDIS